MISVVTTRGALKAVIRKKKGYQHASVALYYTKFSQSVPSMTARVRVDQRMTTKDFIVRCPSTTSARL